MPLPATRLWTWCPPAAASFWAMLASSKLASRIFPPWISATIRMVPIGIPFSRAQSSPSSLILLTIPETI